jgi:hypothetical protein
MNMCGVVIAGASAPEGKGFIIQCVLPYAHTGEHRDAVGNQFSYVPTAPSAA